MYVGEWEVRWEAGTGGWLLNSMCIGLRRYTLSWILKVVGVTGVQLQVVELGVHLAGAGPGMSNLSLLYTDVATHYSSQTIASFLLPSSFSRWARFALKVTADDVTVYYNCQRHETLPVKREPQELVFDSASTLYVGQAGPIIKGALDVSTRN